jgi:DNA-binding GntR family transcriptional regulator
MMVDTPQGRIRPRRQLSEHAASFVRELIVSGQVRSGEFLRIEPISEALDISNTPVREGLLMLSRDGFIQLVPRRGFMVSSFTRQDVRDIFWAQASLAAELTRRAAKTISGAQLDLLAAVVDEHTLAVRVNKDSERAVILGHEFHRTINLAANSRRLALLLRSMVQQLPNQFYNGIEGHEEDTLQAHPVILEALMRRRSKEAGTLMSDHIMSGVDQLVLLLEQRDLWADNAIGSAFSA